MKTTKATALLLCLLLSGCRPVYVIVTQEAKKQPEKIKIKTNQPWNRTNIQDVLNTVKNANTTRYRADNAISTAEHTKDGI